MSYTLSAASALVLPGPLWFITASLAALFAIFYPVVLAIILSKRLKVGTHYAGFGALIFFLFQVISRIPLVQLANGALQPALRTSQLVLGCWLIVLALTAGLCEEYGRYIGYRWFMRKEEKTWGKALMYGVGHGGLESMLLVGVSLAVSVAIGLVLATLPSGALSARAVTALGAQYNNAAAQPGWLPLLGLWERLWVMPWHLALSVIVAQVFIRGQRRWLWIAIAAHALADFLSVAVPSQLGLPGLKADFLSEGVVLLIGLLALLVIRWLRPAQPAAAQAPMSPGYDIVPRQK
jgi:uncharacterized membrane protein YhfC